MYVYHSHNLNSTRISRLPGFESKAPFPPRCHRHRQQGPLALPRTLCKRVAVHLPGPGWSAPRSDSNPSASNRRHAQPRQSTLLRTLLKACPICPSPKMRTSCLKGCRQRVPMVLCSYMSLRTSRPFFFFFFFTLSPLDFDLFLLFFLLLLSSESAAPEVTNGS